MLSAEIIAQIRMLEIRAKQQVTSVLLGEYHSAFKGTGMEFDDVRGYQPGDDIRSIDWNVTARTGEPHIKTFREERELNVMLMVDVSPSQLFGSTGRSKMDTAAELAAILAFLAIKNNDKIGLTLFSNEVEHFIKPRKGRNHVWAVIRDILTFQASGQTTNLTAALRFVHRTMPRRGVCFLLSDFIDDGFHDGIKHLAKKHDVTCVLTEDRRERAFPRVGLVNLQHLEQKLLWTYDSNKIAQTTHQLQRERDLLIGFFKKNDINFFSADTSQAPSVNLINYLHQREMRRVQR